MSKNLEVNKVASNALIALGALSLSVGFALPYTALQVFIEYPNDPEAQERANGYANMVNAATRAFLILGSTAFLLGIGIGLKGLITIRKDALIALLTAIVFVIGGALVFYTVYKPN